MSNKQLGRRQYGRSDTERIDFQMLLPEKSVACRKLSMGVSENCLQGSLGPQLPDDLKSRARRLQFVAQLDTRTVDHRYSGVLRAISNSGDFEVFDDKHREIQQQYRTALEFRFGTADQCEAAILQLYEALLDTQQQALDDLETRFMLAD